MQLKVRVSSRITNVFLCCLQKTTPAAAKQILNGQPSISYALITLMVAMNAIKLDVFYVR